MLPAFTIVSLIFSVMAGVTKLLQSIPSNKFPRDYLTKPSVFLLLLLYEKNQIIFVTVYANE